MNMGRICLVVLIGLPGAGKTTFCQHLMQMQLLPFNILHFCFDNFINVNSESITQYKSQRMNILQFLKEIIRQFKNPINIPETLHAIKTQYKSNQQNDTIILCDDNHYYRSMRYKVFQIAREENVGYCQIYFNCKAHLALERNSLRHVLQKIPNDVILQMCCRLEVPNALNHQWEKNTIILQASNLWEQYDDELIPFIINILNNPVQPLHVAVSKAATPQSNVHELDLLLRKHIKFLMNSNQNKNSIMAKTLNDKRKETLVQFQKDITSSMQDIDINKYVERFKMFIDN